MKYLKKYKLFENVQSIHDLCKQYGITDYTINEDGSIDVDGSVWLHSRRLTKLPLKFRNVGGDFYCRDNQLTSLEGAPQSVMGDFSCSDNQLTSLEGAPQTVGGDFNCHSNRLTSLEGAPQTVGGHFYCYNNPISIIWDLFEDYSKVELFNDYDPVREIDGKPALVIDRLNMFLEEIGKDPVKKVDGWINI
jgi:hypothetical protein